MLRSVGWDLRGHLFLPVQQLIFNSLTNCLGPRKLLHSGKLYKTKSNKELHGFLFNDFLLLTYMVKQFAVSSGSEKLFSSKSNAQFRMYKTVSPASPAEAPPPGLAVPWTPQLSPGARAPFATLPGRVPGALVAAGPALGLGFSWQSWHLVPLCPHPALGPL